MSLNEKNILTSFLICLTLLLTLPVAFPSLKINFFIPFLIIVFYQKSLISSLWFAFGAGLILDLLSSHTHLGIFGADYLITTLLLYQRKRNFFSDSLSTLPIMTYLFAVTSTLVYLILIMLFENAAQLNFKWFYTDLIVMPVLDAVYACVIFIVPLFFRSKRPRQAQNHYQARL